MEPNRRTLVAKILPAVTVGGAMASMTGPANATPTPGTPDIPSLGACITCSGGKFANYEEFEAAFHEFGQLNDSEIRRLATMQTGRHFDGVTTMAIPLPGPAAIIQCALSAAWIFRKGTNKNTIIGQLADTIVSCVGIPIVGGLVLPHVMALIWKYKKKIIAALSAIGLTAAQLAPLAHAPKP